MSGTGLQAAFRDGPFFRAVPRERRVRAADLAWRDKAWCDAPERPSRFKARVVACERFREVWLVRLRPARFCFFADAEPRGGGGTLMPALRAFESPMAMACLGFRTPCFPSRT